MEILQLLGGASGAIVAICAIFLGLFAPVLLIYAVYSALRSLRRIANALDHVVYDVPRMRRDIVKATEERAAQREPGVVNSAFGR